MLNKEGIRELAYVVKIDNITAIPGYMIMFLSPVKLGLYH